VRENSLMSLVSSPFGRRAFIAGVAGTTAAVSLASAADAAIPAGASYYVPVQPTRLADTRTYAPYTSVYKNFTRPAPNTIRIKIAGITGIPGIAQIPVDAVAAVVSVAVIGNGAGGYMRATPAGQDSFVANVVLDAADGVVTNLATVKLSADGYIDVKGSQPYDVVVDLSGVYLPAPATGSRAGRVEHLPAVQRLADGIAVSHGNTLRINVPAALANADAAIVNLTAANAFAGGFLTAFPAGTSLPETANVNFNPGETRGAGSIVKLNTVNGARGFDVYLWGGAQVYADLSGYVTGPSATESTEGLFVPIVPVRLLDTRTNADVAKAGGKKRLWPGWTRPFRIPDNANGFPVKSGSSQVAAVAMNLTSVESMSGGFITVLPAQTQRAFVSNLNVSRVGQNVSNHVITKVSTQGVECYSRWGAHVVCDVAGWYVGTPVAATLPVPVDPAPPPAALPWALNVPKMGLSNVVEPDVAVPDNVVDRGQSWHWTNTGYVGDTAAVVAFGHRTSAGGPYRYQHYLAAGDVLYVATIDQRLFTYRWQREELTNSAAVNILDASRRIGGSTFTLVACTGPKSGTPNDQPLGHVTYRIVSTFLLESWVDTSPTID
jgi:hypothetical protein